MKRFNEEQLQRRYQQSIDAYGCNGYFDFVVHAKEMSCQPMDTFKDYLNEMNRECKKSFLLWLWNNEEDIQHDFYRMFSTTLKAI